MEKKYMLTDETKVIDGRTLHRIKALKDFGDIEAGSLGGFIEKEENLSQEGEAWVYDDALVFEQAKVYGNALVYGKAQIYDNARIHGNAQVYDDVQVYGDAQVYGNAWVYGNARVGSNAKIYDNAWVHGDARIRDDAQVFGSAKVYGDTRVYGNAKVYEDAIINEDSIVCGNAKIFNQARISGHSIIHGNVQIGQKISIKDANCHSLTLEESIRCQTGLVPFNGSVIAYKQVKKDLTSFYDNDFQYKIGEWAEAKNFEISDESCAGGLHFSNANYWNAVVSLNQSSFLVARIRLEDIITVQEGKIRCKKAFILGKYDTPPQD